MKKCPICARVISDEEMVCSICELDVNSQSVDDHPGDVEGQPVAEGPQLPKVEKIHESIPQVGYLVGWARIASYLGAALGILLIIGAILSETFAGAGLLYYGTIILFMSLVGIGATAWLRDINLEREEVDQYYSIVPRRIRLRTPKFIQPILSRWRTLPTERQNFLVIVFLVIPALIISIVFLILLCLICANI